jgi:FtsP/CotA-like multicopper oxidase with cupredoxin domain
MLLPETSSIGHFEGFIITRLSRTSMVRTGRTNTILVALTIAGVLASSVVLFEGLRASQSTAGGFPAVVLPAGCVRPAGGYLIVASQYGYNDSVLNGAGPSKAWPVISVTQGQTVSITVCNADSLESHGFQVGTYYDKSVVSIAPGQVVSVSFVASKAGDFPIYCAIFCAIHLFMEYGQLRVTSS